MTVPFADGACGEDAAAQTKRQEEDRLRPQENRNPPEKILTSETVMCYDYYRCISLLGGAVRGRNPRV